MFDLEGEWSISFAGCGFMGIYYVGLTSCFLERAPFLVKEAKRIYGASSGALTATVLALGMPLAKCCSDLMGMATAARGRSLGPLHPSFDMLKFVRDFLTQDLPADAHLLATGRLCVSLTRMSDGQNVLVSEFSTREELIQALVCSCFIPIYSGLILPSFRGVRYMDGALSNNQPQYKLKDTITIAPFAGNCVVCPRDNVFRLHTVRVCSASFHVNLLNVRRIARVFFPPDPQIMAEICQNGYKDGLQFLKENNLLRLHSPSAGLSALEDQVALPACCCGDEDDKWQSFTNHMDSTKDSHWWLDKQIIDNLPSSIKKVLCEACREKHGLCAPVTDLLPVHMAPYMPLPMESAYSVAQRLVQWIPEVAEDVRWLFGMAMDVYRQAWKGEDPKAANGAPLCRKTNPAMDLQGLHMEDSHQHPSSTDILGSDWAFPSTPPLPLTPPPTPPRGSAPETTPPCSSSSAPAPAKKTDSPPTAPKNTWILCLQWAAGWMSPGTFDPAL
ncbi:hypothetical protein AAFF_G00369470 [Aldrovandia affinis]|uniref:triacylglycerol lipase n=1 Tax=Aldrovandia affinis TaxID=143900 RepID=A0AAD7SH83_9TELE|nr:hypothetical protein AAFF_G00369470 [Aldrovandia affinis]